MPNDILKMLADNPALFDATKKAVLDEFEFIATDDNSRTDEQLGQIVRAHMVGKRKIEEAFRKIGRLRSNEKQSTGQNPGR